MSWLEKWKDRRRRAQVARLRREIVSLESLILRLSPDYDHAEITQTADKLVAKRRALAALTTNRKDS